MIQTEILSNGQKRHYSDKNKRIIQNETNIEYDEAVDVIPCSFTYRESENDIEIISLSEV